MVEVYLFIIVGAVAIIAATMMLLSENAVHSAMFLILNFACVAFLYLMLDAPFLAMVQIAVYAGAIMVLFLFVIMLLGAEQAETPSSSLTEAPGSRYHTWVALVLALVTLVATAIGIGQGEVNTLENNGEPMLRVVHASAAANLVDVLLDGEILKANVAYRETTGFTTLPAGTYEIEVVEPLTEETIWAGEVEIAAPTAPGEVTTVVVYGMGEEAQFAAFTENFGAPGERQATVTVFNAFDEAVSLQDVGILNRLEDGRVLASAVEPGEVSEAALLSARVYDSLRLVRPADEADDSPDVNAFFNVTDREFDRSTSTLLVVTEQAGADFPNVSITTDRTMMPFGSPQAVGERLFTVYLLPLQVVGLLLLAALVGVIVVAQRQVSTVGQRSSTARPVRRRVSRPLASVIASQVQQDDSDNTPSLSSGD